MTPKNQYMVLRYVRKHFSKISSSTRVKRLDNLSVDHTPAVFVGNVGLPPHLKLRKPGKRQRLDVILKALNERFNI